MSDKQDRLARENSYVLTAVQALLGRIDPSVEAVALRFEGDRLYLRFWAHGDPSVAATDGAETIGEMEGLYGPDLPQIDVEVRPGSPSKDAQEWAGRFLYWAKTPDSAEYETDE